MLPLVGSIITAPGLSAPLASASSIIAFAILSFTLPAGVEVFELCVNVCGKLVQSCELLSFNMGVPPIRSVILSNVLIVIFSFSIHNLLYVKFNFSFVIPSV